MDWYKIWQDNNYFEVEKNILKKKEVIFTNFINTHHQGFLDGSFRPYIYADSIARYYRFKDINVLNAIGFINSNKDYLNTFIKEIERLNIGYSKAKLVDTKNKNVIYLAQKIFLNLYHKGLISYKDSLVYKIDNNYLDEINLDNKQELSLEKVFVLKYEKYLDKIVEHIDNLSIDKDTRDYLYNKLGKYESISLELNTKTNKNISITLEKPEELASLQAILINPNYVDILEYMSPKEIFSVENFLLYRDKPYLNTGNYIINPLTGKNILLYLSFKYDEPFKMIFSTENSTILEEIGLRPINIYSGSLLINSDFLNGLTKDEARAKLIEIFTEEGIASSTSKYSKKEIVISNSNKQGIIIPLALSQGDITSLDDNIPLYYTNLNNITYNNDLGNVKLFDITLNNNFIASLEILLSVIEESITDISSLTKNNVIDELVKWLNNITLVISKRDLVANLLLPIILISIIEVEENINLLNYVEIKIIEDVYDNYGNEIKRRNNNCIKIEDIIATYGADSIRLYYLSFPINNKLFFDENKIFIHKQFINKVKTIYKKGFLVSNYDLEFPIYQLKNKLYDALVSLDFSSYIKYIEDFFINLKEETLTKKQALDLLILLAIVAPSLAEELNNTELRSKQLIIDLPWPI